MSDILQDLQSLAADAEEKYRVDIAEIADGRPVRKSDLADAAATGRTAANIAGDVEALLGAREVVAKRREIETLQAEIADAQKATEAAVNRSVEARREAEKQVRPFEVAVDEARARERQLQQRQLDLRGEIAHLLRTHCTDSDPQRPKWSKPRE